MARQYAKDQPLGFSNHVKNIAIVGASGSVGSPITAELLKTGQHSVTAITRTDSKSSFADGVKVAKVDYDDHASLVRGMSGQDALVITMGVFAPKDSVAKLVKAAIDAGVHWILPNEWGFDYTDAEINRDSGLGEAQLATRRLIESEGTSFAWIAVACGFWYEYCLPGGMNTFGFEFDKKQVTFYDDGNFKMNYSTLTYCGQAVAKLLSLPILPQDANDQSLCLDQYRNEICRIRAFELDQKDMLASVLRVTGGKEGDWTVKHDSSETRYNEGKEQFQKGVRGGGRLMLFARMFYPSNTRKRPDEYSDERLGLLQPALDDATRKGLELVNEQS